MFLLEIQGKDIVSILHLLVALKEHFAPNNPITPGVYMTVVVVQVTKETCNVYKTIRALW